MSDVKISVIVPIYKVEKFLPLCVESLLNQTMKDIEIILVDDGSPDNCPKMCDEYGEKYENVKVIHKENGGLSDARNAGLEIAEGEWIGFVDSDDYIDEIMFETLYNLVDETGAYLSMCDFCWVDEENKPLEIDENIEYLDGCYDEKDIYTKLNSVDAGHYVIAWNKLYHHSLFKNIRFPVGKLNEDQYIMHEILFNAGKIVCTAKKLYNYRKASGSIMNSTYSVRRLDDVEGLHKRFCFYEEMQFVNRLYQTERLAFNKFKMGLKKLKFEKEHKDRIRELMGEQKACYRISKKKHKYSMKEKLDRMFAMMFPILYWKSIAGR